ncbi:sugar transferase [Pediococcus siamensis]|uniref:sugar transferase n=1 Tax=Pediococcus siamensis TaxID=381829 RepID=UPI0039A2F27D
MRKFVMQVKLGQKNTSGQKAKEDITKILSDDGYKVLGMNVSQNKFIKLITIPYKVNRGLKEVEKNDIVVVQYPMYSRLLIKNVIKRCKKRGAKVIGIIHDVESLRFLKGEKRKSIDELNIFNSCDCLVSHNENMTGWLRLEGVKTKIVSLEIFDYLTREKEVSAGLKKDLVFAGNLSKSSFLEKWYLDEKIKVFGINPGNYSKSIKYMGVKTPNELPKYLDGSFGLVWDGNSMSTNAGVYGEYTKYNNPHKVSLYLSSGLPVIVWKQAAIAKFVQENRIGLVVESLYELPKVLGTLSDANYEVIKDNVHNLSVKFKCGYFTKRAVKSAIEAINGKKNL